MPGIRPPADPMAKEPEEEDFFIGNDDWESGGGFTINAWVFIYKVVQQDHGKELFCPLKSCTQCTLFSSVKACCSTCTKIMLHV